MYVMSKNIQVSLPSGMKVLGCLGLCPPFTRSTQGVIRVQPGWPIKEEVWLAQQPYTIYQLTYLPRQLGKFPGSQPVIYYEDYCHTHDQC